MTIARGKRRAAFGGSSGCASGGPRSGESEAAGDGGSGPRSGAAPVGAGGDAGSHAVVILDRAGRHTSNRLAIPGNIALLPLPPRLPELNPVVTVRRPMRDDWLSNRTHNSRDDMVAHRREAWTKLPDHPRRITSTGLRGRSHGLRSMRGGIRYAFGSSPAEASEAEARAIVTAIPHRATGPLCARLRASYPLWALPEASPRGEARRRRPDEPPESNSRKHLP